MGERERDREMYYSFACHFSPSSGIRLLLVPQHLPLTGGESRRVSMARPGRVHKRIRHAFHMPCSILMTHGTGKITQVATAQEEWPSTYLYIC